MNSEPGHDSTPSVSTLELSPTKAPAVPKSPNAAPERRPATRGPVHEDMVEQDRPKGFARYRLPIIIGVLGLGGILVAQNILSKAASSPQPKQEEQTVRIVMPPSTPPPPLPPPPPQQEIKQDKPMEAEEKPEEADPAPAQVQTASTVKGAGGGPILARGNGNGAGFFKGNAANEEKMRRSAYAGMAQSQIANALRNNPKTRKAAMRLEIRIWPDAAGRISRATLSPSTGDAALDAVIRDEVLTGLQLPEPPPEGMPTPIVMRVTARRPN